MAKLFPSFQTFVTVQPTESAGGQETVGITKVTLISGSATKTGTDHFNLPVATDVQILAASFGGSKPNFYLNANQSRVSIDGNVGQVLTFVSRHNKDKSYITEDTNVY